MEKTTEETLLLVRKLVDVAKFRATKRAEEKKEIAELSSMIKRLEPKVIKCEEMLQILVSKPENQAQRIYEQNKAVCSFSFFFSYLKFDSVFPFFDEIFIQILEARVCKVFLEAFPMVYSHDIPTILLTTVAKECLPKESTNDLVEALTDKLMV